MTNILTSCKSPILQSLKHGFFLVQTFFLKLRQTGVFRVLIYMDRRMVVLQNIPDQRRLTCSVSSDQCGLFPCKKLKAHIL